MCHVGVIRRVAGRQHEQIKRACKNCKHKSIYRTNVSLFIYFFCEPFSLRSVTIESTQSSDRNADAHKSHKNSQRTHSVRRRLQFGVRPSARTHHVSVSFLFFKWYAKYFRNEPFVPRKWHIMKNALGIQWPVKLWWDAETKRNRWRMKNKKSLWHLMANVRKCSLLWLLEMNQKFTVSAE